MTPTVSFHSLPSEEVFITGETKDMGVSLLWQDEQMNISFALKFASQANTTKFFLYQHFFGGKRNHCYLPSFMPTFRSLSTMLPCLLM